MPTNRMVVETKLRAEENENQICILEPSWIWKYPIAWSSNDATPRIEAIPKNRKPSTRWRLQPTSESHSPQMRSKRYGNKATTARFVGLETDPSN